MAFQFAFVSGCLRYSTARLKTNREAPHQRLSLWRWGGGGEQRIFLDLATVFSESVHATGKYREDGEKILGKLGRGAEYSLVENHEFSTVVLHQILDEVKAKACKTVSVGNHKRELIACEKAL